MKPKHPYGFAFPLAEEIIKQLKPHTSNIEIAGSLRRECPTVSDIEIVCIPKEDNSAIRDINFVNAVENLGLIWKGNVENGRYVSIIVCRDMKLDLFITNTEDFYRQLAIRTGCAEYSHKVIATAWTKLGWVGTEHGLRRRTDCVKKNNTWKVVNDKGERPPKFNSEKEFFEWLKIKWIAPKYRSFPYYLISMNL